MSDAWKRLRSAMHDRGVSWEDAGRFASEVLDDFAHELAEKQRELLRQGFRQPGYASVMNSLGQHEPLGTTHVIDHIDPEIMEIRPARVALAELSPPEVLNSGS